MSDRDDRDALEMQLSEAASRMSLWRSLMESPAWKEFVRLQTEQMRIRQAVVLTTPLNPDSNIYAQEFLKGEFSGVQSALEFPQNQFEAAKRDVSMLNVQLENYDDAEAAREPPKSRVDTDDHFG